MNLQQQRCLLSPSLWVAAVFFLLCVFFGATAAAETAPNQTLQEEGEQAPKAPRRTTNLTQEIHPNVFTLKSQFFERYISPTTHHGFRRDWMVLMYSTWCDASVCDRISYPYRQLAQRIADRDLQWKITLAKHEIDHDDGLMLMRYKIEGVPTLLWFSKDVDKQLKPEVYAGELDFESLAQYVQERSGYTLLGEPEKKKEEAEEQGDEDDGF